MNYLTKDFVNFHDNNVGISPDRISFVPVVAYTGFYQATGWTIEWSDSTLYTNFRVTVNGLASDVRSVYYAFGLSNDRLMVIHLI